MERLHNRDIKIHKCEIDCERSLLDLVKGVHARASIERRSLQTRESRAAAREEKRDCSHSQTQCSFMTSKREASGKN